MVSGAVVCKPAQPDSTDRKTGAAAEKAEKAESGREGTAEKGGWKTLQMKVSGVGFWVGGASRFSDCVCACESD